METLLNNQTTLEGQTLLAGHFERKWELHLIRLLHGSAEADFYLAELVAPSQPDDPQKVIAVLDHNCWFGEAFTLKSLLDDLYEQVIAKHLEKPALDYDGVVPSMPICTETFKWSSKKFVLFNLDPELFDSKLEMLLPGRAKQVSTHEAVWLTERLLRVIETLHMYDLTFDNYLGPRYLVEWEKQRLLLVGFQRYRCQVSITELDVKDAFSDVSQLINQLWLNRPKSSETKYFEKFLGYMQKGEFSSAENARQALLGFFPELKEPITKFETERVG